MFDKKVMQIHIKFGGLTHFFDYFSRLFSLFYSSHIHSNIYFKFLLKQVLPKNASDRRQRSKWQYQHWRRWIYSRISTPPRNVYDPNIHFYPETSRPTTPSGRCLTPTRAATLTEGLRCPRTPIRTAMNRVLTPRKREMPQRSPVYVSTDETPPESPMKEGDDSLPDFVSLRFFREGPRF